MELRSSDVAVVRDQLGREPTTPFAVVARCAEGHPLVIRNHPVDSRGEPFPTLYWLTCPEAVRRVSHLESDGRIRRLNVRADEDAAFGAALRRAHQAYAREREREVAGSGQWGGVGGTRIGVKCLHAHFAYHLAGGIDPVGELVADEIGPIHPRAGERVAAVDLGTNSIRLLVAEAREDSELRELARDMVITRIGRGVDRTGTIDPQSLRRTVEVLASYCRRARALGASRIRVAATSAVRDASNREELFDAVRRHAGSELEVISGEREGGLSFLGATQGLKAPPPYLVLDIGGGSTEFVLGTDEPERAVSMQMGSVRLTERFISTDPPSPAERAELMDAVDRVLNKVPSHVPGLSGARTLVAVAGTATTVQAIALGRSSYDPEAIHRTELSRDDAEAVLERLAEMTSPERAALPVMASGREDVIVAGATILVRVMRRFDFAKAIVSETDILDGLAIEMAQTR